MGQPRTPTPEIAKNQSGERDASVSRLRFFHGAMLLMIAQFIIGSHTQKVVPCPSFEVTSILPRGCARSSMRWTVPIQTHPLTACAALFSPVKPLKNMGEVFSGIPGPESLT